MPFTKEELEELRPQLPTSVRKELANKLGITSGHLRNVLGGHSKNDDVVIAAIEAAKAHKQKLANAKATIASL